MKHFALAYLLGVACGCAVTTVKIESDNPESLAGGEADAEAQWGVDDVSGIRQQ